MMAWARIHFKKLYLLYLLRRQALPPFIRDHLQECLRLNVRQKVLETDFVVFDTETTGLHASRGDRIVSISAIRVRQGRIDLSDTFHELVDPNRDIPSTSVVIHGILPRMVIGKPTIEEILPRLIAYFDASVLVAHHAWLDMAFLNREMVRLYGVPIQSYVLDSAVFDQALHWARSPHLGGSMKTDSSLSALAQRYRVQVNGQHSSFGDALTTAEIFQRMLKQAHQQGMVSLKDLLRKACFPMTSMTHGVSPM